MKKLKGILVLFVTILLLVLTACGGDTANSDGATKGENKISIFVSKVEITEELEALAKEYQQETGVEVEVWGTTGDDYFQQLQIRLNSNQGPSIFSLRHLTEAIAMESYAYDLSNESYIPYIADNMALELNGKVLGVPFGVEGFGLVYNKNLISPADVADYNAFVRTLERFHGSDVTGLSLSQEGFFLIGHISNLPFSLQENNISFMDKLSAGEVTMAETKEFQQFGELMEVIRAYSRNPLEVTYDSQIGDFASGKTAMIHQGNWANGMLADYNIDFEYGMLPVPLANNDKLAVGVGMNWSVNANKSQEEIQLALDFLEWMHTSPTGHRYIVEEFKAIPALTNIEPSDLDPLSQAVFEATSSGNTIPWSHTYYPANLVVNDFVPAAQNFFINRSVTGEAFIRMLDEAWQFAQ